MQFKDGLSVEIFSAHLQTGISESADLVLCGTGRYLCCRGAEKEKNAAERCKNEKRGTAFSAVLLLPK